MNIMIKGMTFSYSSVSVLNDICLNISGPQMVSILGPNGVGKSTLIHCINKILTPTGGAVLLDDKDVNEYSLKEMAKKIGYVPYASSDTFPLTVVDTVLLGRHPHANWKTSDEDLQIVYDTLKKLDIEDLAVRYFNELSAGQHQKVMLARGLVQKPNVLLLDEPTANLDVKHQLSISRLLKKLSHEDDLLVIMISHDLNIAAKYSDAVILMHDGRIYDVGSPEKVITAENIEKVYGVKSSIIMNEGRPHVILEDPESMRCTPVKKESICVMENSVCENL
ncbi:iron ABC transporter ATP-binding protein [Candidatus Methanomassiliicoccus intestinalis]|uniref:Iron ABC transporter, ATP-binding protein n=1 Tax=Methanomassiliicoccus intestinalis (strain Issoire-Mx1) TaxID=1295009 RepID=R9T7B5_METII|nr:ABC transporter ATP-binding protein [Candidatus Methanomassiliicoccus intestinalis]AGN26544.1 iron ABC transporter, ATP-binding protein [Candidatus Methanomassiliicoccus intestinalis Issoire-Mx1]TQS84196.1 MAG: iron ABC transporter ATP-binding protein [Candidatus Methanomassiliicoccus intestinalis]